MVCLKIVKNPKSAKSCNVYAVYQGSISIGIEIPARARGGGGGAADVKWRAGGIAQL